MSEAFDVDLDRLESVVARLSGLAGFVDDHLATLDRKVAAVHAGSWTGVAAEAHRTAHREWAAGAAEFVAGISEMSAAARQAHGHYSEAQDVNDKMLGGG
ncbi:WXG100 family type VII secretion target [Nocardia sp. NPDC004068]|uniref:WXG100 family type VII secretion target n=1 Tax=Nocardia sp. NPDC004068 TaxID=3364303 RepID=UPI003695E304